jgi:AraC-like DNA-binding protein
MPVRARDAMRPAAAERRSFSTAGLPAAQRIERWESHNAAALIALDVRTGGELDATETNLQLPLVRLARVSGSAHAVERSAAVIARSPADSVAVYLTLRGDAWFSSADGTRELHPGDALVCATDQPFARGFAHGLEELVVTVPCSALGHSPARQPTIIGFGAAAGGVRQYARALARLTGRATGTGSAPPPDERTVLDLTAVLVAGRNVAPATAHRAAASVYIEEHLTDPGLSADRIAAAVGISERQLSRVFAANSSSVPRHILTRRLQLAYATLLRNAANRDANRDADNNNADNRGADNGGADNGGADDGGPGGTEATVADVAARCGFTSAAYFSHAFRRQFGFRAGDLRRGAPASDFRHL